jgi:hypothetical protein
MGPGPDSLGKGQIVFDLVTQFEAARLELDSIEVDAVGAFLYMFQLQADTVLCVVGCQARAICSFQVRVRVHRGLDHGRLRKCNVIYSCKWSTDEEFP